MPAPQLSRSLAHLALPFLALTPLMGCGADEPAAGTQGDAQPAKAVRPVDVATSADVAAEAERVPVRNAALAPFRQELLSLGFKVASKLPMKPLHKDRARAQRRVVRGVL